MLNYKLLAVLTAFLFLTNEQMSFAQTDKCFNFNCSPSYPTSNCNLFGSDNATNNTSEVEVWHGRPRITNQGCSAGVLFLNYWRCNGTYGSDGLALKYQFKAGKTYKIRYKVAVTTSIPFVLDFIATNFTPAVQYGNIQDPSLQTCGVSGYSLPPYTSDAVNMVGATNRFTNGNANSGIASNYTPDNNCTFQERTFNYLASSDQNRMYLRLDECGWSIPNGSAQIRFDEICIEEVCALNVDADFKLKIISTTRTFTGGLFPPFNYTTQNRFNFEIEPVEQLANSYKLEVFKSNTETDNINFLTNILTLSAPSTSNPIKINTRDGISRDPMDPNPTRGDNGFLYEDTQAPECYFYKITLTVVKCGATKCFSRVVKPCYRTNIRNADKKVVPYNTAFNFTVSDNNAGMNRTRTFVARHNYGSPTHYWGGSDYNNGYSNTFFGPFSEIARSTTNGIYSEQFYHPVNGTGEFVRVRTFYYESNQVTTDDGLIVYDRIEASSCNFTALRDEPQNALLQKVGVINKKSDLNIFPNPTAEQSAIRYNLAQSGKVNIYLTDVTGKKITELIRDKDHEVGNYETLFVRKDIINGMYFVVLESSQGKVVKKLVLN